MMSFYSCSGCSTSGRKKKKQRSGIGRIDTGSSTDQANLNARKTEESRRLKCGLREGIFYPVKKEVDGDTFWLDDGCAGVKIRLIGIDAPESRNAFGNIRKEPFGKEATRYMSQLLENSKVRVEFDVDSLDQFGRTLAYCFTDSGVFLNRQMIKNGLAKIQTVQPNIHYQDSLYKSQLFARSKRVNLWGDFQLE